MYSKKERVQCERLDIYKGVAQIMKHTQEQVREALMRLSMCARKECEICKYKDRPKTELPSDDCKERSTKNMNILADVCLRAEHPTEKGGEG